MNIIEIDRVIIATEDLDETKERFEDLLGLRFGREDVEAETQSDPHGEQNMRSAVSDIGVDIVSPQDADNEVARFLEEHGPGLYSFVLRVADLEAAKEELAEKGVEPVGEAHSGEFREYFYHPDDFGNVFVLLCEYPHPVNTHF